nr:hypothetical protein [Shewanella sp. 38A_GOM-205m]
MSGLTITFVEFGLNEKWSPEQIAGVGKIIGYNVSHEWIYGYVQRDKLCGGKLYKQLRQSHYATTLSPSGRIRCCAATAKKIESQHQNEHQSEETKYLRKVLG